MVHSPKRDLRNCRHQQRAAWDRFLEGRSEIIRAQDAAYCHEQGKLLEKYPYRKYMDQGVHDIQLMVAVGSPDDLKETVSSLADFLSMPPVAYSHLPLGSIDRESAGQPEIRDLLHLDKSNVTLLAFLKSSNRDELNIRLQESIGKKTEATLRLCHPSLELNLRFEPFEIKTILVDKAGKWREARRCASHPIVER